MTAFTDGTAANGNSLLATRDYGGDGPDLLFIHGAGQSLVDCGVLTPYLSAHHRVVAMDLRGHGYSSDGRFSLPNALDDVDAVISSLRLDRPAVVGHSLGGIIAAQFGAQHPGISGVINLDGHGPGQPHHYQGVPRNLVVERLNALQALQNQQIAEQRVNPPTLSESMRDAVAAQNKAQYGLDDEFLQDLSDRMFRRVHNGFAPRVSPDTTSQILDEVSSLDLAQTYRACRAPLLVYNAVAPLPPAGQGPEWMAEHNTAYRRGLSRELTTLAQELAQMSYIELEATHMLHYEQPELIAKQVVDFLARQG